MKFLVPLPFPSAFLSEGSLPKTNLYFYYLNIKVGNIYIFSSP